MIYSIVLSILTATAHFNAYADSDSISKVVNLGEVRITATRHKIDDHGGKLVYNAFLEKVRTDVSTFDLIRKVPMLSVDLNGNVSIRGNSNVKILVNGHSFGLLSSNQILEQISPADVLKVEVITTPGARYEAQGTGGIINIVTSKKMYFKSSGYLNAGVGTKGSHLMGNFNYALDKNWTLQNSFYSLIGYSGISNTNNYSGNSEGRNLGQLYSYQGGLSRHGDYSILDLNLQYLYQDVAYKETRDNGEIQKNKNDYHYLSASADYCLTLSDKVKFNAQGRWYYLPATSMMERSGYPNFNSGNRILGQMTQIGWTLNPSRKLELETGLSNNYSHFSDKYNPDIIKLINNFGTYFESKYAVTPMFSVTGGLRYEFYYIDTDINRKSSYHDLFYNFGLDYKASAVSTISLMFSRRTDRPTYASLLSNTSYQGGDVVQQGNQSIQPSYSYQLEGGLSFYVGDCFFKLSPYYRYTDSPMSLFMQPENGLLRQSTVNLSQEHDYGAELWATLSLMRGKLNFNGGLDVMHKKLDYCGINNQGWQFNYSMNITWRLSPTIYVNCYGSWQNKKIYLQGREDSYLYSNLSVQKSWHSDHYRVALSFDNPFSNGVNVVRNYTIVHTDFNSQTRYHNTGIRVFFVYKFGKHDMEKKMKINKNILNTY